MDDINYGSRRIITNKLQTIITLPRQLVINLRIGKGDKFSVYVNPISKDIILKREEKVVKT